MSTTTIFGWERSMTAARDRLRRATAALESHRIPYAVIGGYAVAEWAGRGVHDRRR